MTNLLACLVHENRPVVDDLVANLRALHPGSPILLYNGGAEADLLAGLDRLGGVVVHPDPQPQAWGTLHRFALDAMRFALREVPFDTLTVVDSDQLALQAGFEAALAEAVADRPRLGMLSSAPARQPSRTRVGPPRTMYREGALWRPFLARFPGGADALVHWTFWPATVFTRAGAEALVDLFETDPQLPGLLRRSKTWATEEVLFPTFLAALGFEIGANVGSLDLVKYREAYSVEQLRAAARRPDVFWVHPVPRHFDDPLRAFIREHVARLGAGGDGMARPRPATPVVPAPRTPLLATLPILKRMRSVEGWLEDDEADLLIAATSEACRTLPDVKAVVEVGSYCGRSTVVLGSVVQAFDPEGAVYAVDPHEGEVGAAGLDAHRTSPTFCTFQRTIARAGLEDVVHPIRQRSFDVAWDAPIRLLLIDGLHDYENVARDLRHFESHLAPGAFVAFHDYADYYPGVQRFVDEIVAGGGYRWLGRARSLAVVQRIPEAARDRTEAASGKARVVAERSAPEVARDVPSFAETADPLVTCVMLTAGRRSFVPQAVALFQRQTYGPRELLVVDDGPEAVDDLLPDDPRIRHLRLNGPLRIGAKRNLGAEAARGAVLSHWDDDDWYAPNRLAVQVVALTASGAALSGVAAPLFWSPTSGRAWRYAYPPDGRPWVCGSTLCYWAETWRRRPFQDTQVGEDSLFVWAHAHPEVAAIGDGGLFVGMVHAGNTSPKRTAGRRWRPIDPVRVLDRLGDDAAVYRTIVHGEREPAPEPSEAVRE